MLGRLVQSCFCGPTRDSSWRTTRVRWRGACILPLWGGICIFRLLFRPGWCGSVVGALSHAPKCCRFNSSQGACTRSLVGDVQEAADLCFLSLLLSLIINKKKSFYKRDFCSLLTFCLDKSIHCLKWDIEVPYYFCIAVCFSFGFVNICFIDLVAPIW